MTALSNETESRLRAEVERNTAPFRTPDIAGLCEELRADTPVYNRGPNYEPIMVAPGSLRLKAANTLERQAAEIERLRGALADALDTMIAQRDRFKRKGLSHEELDGEISEARAALTGEDRGHG